ncbi:hypothetical protein EZS27_020341 [termite gut metagenome]|uniref:Alpha-2-macroglobulin domain-containing protein n=1 Tax=termite gut metagenome TaxID=433724 RepID=A0A5J4RC89_9ZZZZ
MMKRILLCFICCLALCKVPALYAQSLSFDKLWKEVEKAEKRSLPQIVVKLTGEIFRKAEAERNSPQMLKASIWRMKHQESLTPDSFYVHLAAWERWVDTASERLDRAVLHSLVAEMYADYAVANRRQLNGSTHMDDEPSADIREWSGNLFVQKVLEHTHMALQDSLLLLNTSSKTYVPFAETGETSDYYGHDMYHLLAMRGTRALGSISSLSDKDSAVTTTVSAIFHNMIDTYRKRNNWNAVALATLDSLNWNGREVPEEQLDKLIAEYGNQEVCAEVYLAKAQYANRNQKYTDALRVCNEAITKYSKYKRIHALENLKQEIQHPHLTVNTSNQTYPKAELALVVNYRNLEGFTVEFHKVSLSALSPKLKAQPDNVFYKKYCRKVDSQHPALPRPKGYAYQDTVITVKAPQTGVYLMRIVAGKAGTVVENLLYVTGFKVITCAIPGNQYEAVVFDAESGKPVPDALVRLFKEKKGELAEVNAVLTDKDGKVCFPRTNETDYAGYTVEKNEDTDMPLQSIGIYHVSDESVTDSPQMILLTDRALYRPGQMVYVKGIAYRSQTDTANVMAGENYTLTLTDANRREIGKKEVRTNEFGSFAASFVLPSGGLNGEYYLKTKDGSTGIRVEEYKRPTFDIVFAPQEGTYQLGDSLRVKGTVKTYSGVPVQEAPVKYTVTRRSYTWLRLFNNDETLLASGSVMPDEAGEFTVPFLLEGEKEVNAFFTYQIEATVTHAAGETQTSVTSIAAGSRSLLLSVKIDKPICKENPGNAVFLAVNLTDMPVNVAGEYKLFPVTATTSPAYAGTFVSNAETSLSAWQSLPSGAYKLMASVADEQGRKVDYEQEVVLFSINDTHPPVDTKIWYYPVSTTFDASHPASFLFGISEKDAYVLTDIRCGNRRLESNVLHLSDSVMRFHYPYKEEYGDGLVLSFCFVKAGQLYRQSVSLEKKLPEKELKITREVFRDKILPGQKEEWKFIVKTPQGLPAEAEMLTFMYDASLDKIWKNNNRTFQVNYPVRLPRFNWATSYTRHIYFSVWFPYTRLTVPGLAYDAFFANPFSFGEMVVGYGKPSGLSQVTRGYTASIEEVSMNRKSAKAFPVGDMQIEASDAPAEVRTHFAETAFFYPQLRTNENGEIVFSFTVPQSLTRWNFYGYAYTKGMLTGMINAETVTSKDLMLTPNLPRFVRTGDKTSVAAAITNLTGKNLVGTVTFTLFDLLTEKTITTQKQTFATEASKTTGVNFLFTADGKQEIVGCRIVAQSGSFSDGEQHLLPVLSNQESIIETLAMPILEKEKKEFSLESLFNNNSKTATNRRLTIEFSGNPAWYAVQALPALSLPTENNAVSLAAAYYANTLAAYIVNANPRIKKAFDAWKLQGGNKETFLSNLQKNQDVKDILLEESPWLTEATNETEQIQRIATLFDLNNIQNNNLTALTKLKDLQRTDGSWSWYQGMQGSRYVTESTVQTLLRLSVLTGHSPDNDVRNMLQLAFDYLHKEAVKEYRRILQEEKQGNTRTGISDAALQYLYLISLSDEKLPGGDVQKAYTCFLQKANESLTTQSLSEKAISAVVLHKAGRTSAANAFIASLKEHAVQTEEQGMYFAFNESPYSWRELKVPTHVSVMEAFDLMGDAQSVEEMKLWLLKQKQTQQWNSPTATVDAVYALLIRGNDVLNSRGDVRITLGSTIMETLSTTAFAGLGYLKETPDSNLLNPPMKITVEKRDAGIAWGAVYARYNEDISKVTRYGKELQVEKKLYVEKIVNNEKRLQLITHGTKLAVGDKVISRITIRLDRPMDFVQLKDRCGACFEPIESLSGYRRSNRTGYYMTVKDASTHFFFDSLNKGVYVLEYGCRVSRVGTYEAGLAVIQSAYAPEYAGHSESVQVEVATDRE